jgi:hypothetical protein
MSFISGCGNSNPAQFQVKGKITLDAKPITKGTVEFIPDGSKATKGPIAFGVINPDGTYELKTFKDKDGAKAGFYKVGIQSFETVIFDPNSPTPAQPKPLIPIKFADAMTSGLFAEVKAGQTEPINFDLTSQ